MGATPAAAPPPTGPEPMEDEGGCTTVLALPQEVLHTVFAQLQAPDLGRAVCVCRGWQLAGRAPLLWEPLCRARWASGAAGQWEALQRRGAWHALYCRRAQVDSEAAGLLRQLQWPARWHASVKALYALGLNNIKDMLEACISAPDAGCGARYWARCAAQELVGWQAAEDMKALLVTHEGRHLEEGAMLLAGLHSPLDDMCWVAKALDTLGAELRRRLGERGVAGGLPALELLGQLLFGPPPPDSHPGHAAFPPPPGYGMGLKGNRDSYYEAENSLIDRVLESKNGIPISLAVIHAAVGARAGLEVRVLGVPMHVVNHFGAEDSEEERFVDVFDEGRIMTREEMGAMMADLGLLGFNRRHLQPMAPAKVYARQCFNLASIYSALGSAGEVAALRMQKGIMRLLGVLDPPDAFSSRMELAKACASLQHFDEALEILEGMAGRDEPLPGSPSATRQLLDSNISRVRAALAEREREEGRGSSSGVRFEVGQVIRHRRYDYRGVICGWDPVCAASEDWARQMGVERLERGRWQPFYHVLVDPRDRGGQQTYVAEENIVLEALPRNERGPGFELHPSVGRYFERLHPDGASYVPNDWMRARYPDD